VRLGGQTLACQRPSFHNGGLVGLASVSVCVEALSSRVRVHDIATGCSLIQSIDLDLILSVQLVTDADAAGALSVVAVEDEGVLPVDIAVGIARLLKVVCDGTFHKNGLPSSIVVA
jgi:hypothetical protein